MLSPNECLGECVSKFNDRAEVFYDLRHQTIFGALVAMYDAKEAIDVITLQQRLKDKQLLEQVGGISYLAALPDTLSLSAREVVLRRADRMEVLSVNRLDDPIDASPVIVGRQLFLRGHNYLYCLQGME